MALKIFEDIPPWEWPEDAARIFLRVLADDKADESERLLAAELGGDFVVINDELVDALLTIVNNFKDSDSLRATAAISLGPVLEYAYMDGFEDAECRALIQGLEKVRMRCAEPVGER